MCRSLGQVNLLFAVFERRVLGLRVREKLHSALHLLFPRRRVILPQAGCQASTNFLPDLH